MRSAHKGKDIRKVLSDVGSYRYCPVKAGGEGGKSHCPRLRCCHPLHNLLDPEIQCDRINKVDDISSFTDVSC
jgi:hypothetical protein